MLLCFVYYLYSAAFGFAIYADWKCILVGAPIILEIIKNSCTQSCIEEILI